MNDSSSQVGGDEVGRDEINNTSNVSVSSNPNNVVPKPPVKRSRTQGIKTTKNRKSSEVLLHFEKQPNDKAKCIYCGDIYTYIPSNGTTTLWSHLQTRSKKYPFRVDKTQHTIDDFSSKNGAGNSTMMVVGSKTKVLDVEALREATAKMCFTDEQHFSFVEGEGFAEPRWIVPCRKTVASNCMKLYEKQKHKMKELLKNQRLSLTTDCWSSIQNLNYLTLTAHFIDDNWKLHKRILNFSLVENYNGETIGRTVESCLVEWGFDKNFTFTVDNASSNNTVVDYLRFCNWRDRIMSNKYLHVRCAAHIVNLIVKEGLKEQDCSIQRIRNAMKFVRSSPQRSNKFQECVLYEKIECKKEVCLDVETRWNSTFLMLQVAIKYKKAFG